MPTDPVNPGDGPTYDNMDLDNNATVRDVWARKYMFYIEDKHMNQALCTFFSVLGLTRNPKNLQRRNDGQPKHEVQGYGRQFLGTLR